MLQTENENGMREGMIADILSPLIAATILFCVLTLAILAGSSSEASFMSFVFPALLLVCALIAQQLQRFQLIDIAGLLMVLSITLFPIATIFFIGPRNNGIMFIAPLGILLGTTLISIRVGLALSMFTALCIIIALFMHLSQLQILSILLLNVFALFAVGAWTNDAVQGTIAWAVDTATKSERRETLLRRTQAELQEAIYERERLNTVLLKTNHDLEVARAAAEAAYASKSSFMARMSHELRTPLNLVIGFSNAMLDHPEMYDNEPLPELYAADVAAIRSSGQHLLGLINDILDLAKVEAGRLELHKAPLQLEPLLEEMHRTFQTLFIDRPVTLTQEWNEPLPTLNADETRLRQILFNLLSNASKFTDEGEIALGAKIVDSAVLIWVRDTGIGIAPEDQARMFRDFEQAESDDSRQRGGTGLGLSICRWLVELHGGQVGLESNVGQGSKFFFTIPIHVETPQTTSSDENMHSDSFYAVTQPLV